MMVRGPLWLLALLAALALALLAAQARPSHNGGVATRSFAAAGTHPL